MKKFLIHEYGNKNYTYFWALWRKSYVRAYKALSIMVDPWVLLNKYCLLIIDFL